jgi:NAD(P)-dependent dehydrogenase (short-subunit alcohol dehydrogenase family)
VALVTGAGQDIGRAFALALAEAGADVAAADLNEMTGSRVADEVGSRMLGDVGSKWCFLTIAVECRALAFREISLRTNVP